MACSCGLGHAHTHARAHAHVHARAHICTHAYTPARTCMHTQTHTHTHARTCSQLHPRLACRCLGRASCSRVRTRPSGPLAPSSARVQGALGPAWLSHLLHTRRQMVCACVVEFVRMAVFHHGTSMPLGRGCESPDLLVAALTPLPTQSAPEVVQQFWRVRGVNSCFPQWVASIEAMPQKARLSECPYWRAEEVPPRCLIRG